MGISLLVFQTALPILLGLIVLLLGIVFSDNMKGLLMLITHRELPEYVKDKPEVTEVLNYFNGIGILFKILGVGLMVYGLLVLGAALF
jgi:hypothetical protein